MKTAKQIFAILLSSYLLITLSGFSIFYHYCSCQSVATTSLLYEYSCCQTEKNIEQSCCTQTKTCCENPCDSCGCETEVKTYKVNDTLPSSGKYRMVVPTLRLYLAATFNLQFDFTPKDSNPTSCIISDDISPQKSGKQLIILQNKLKIPYPIS